MLKRIWLKLKKLIIGLVIIGGVSAAGIATLPDKPADIPINQFISGMAADERARIKSQEIAKLDLSGTYENTQYGIKVEIIGNIKAINIDGQHGIEFFAKAWKGNKQLGFGKDGSVEIERFRIFNPPVLIDDSLGNIIRTGKDPDGNITIRKLTENPAEAIKRSLAHTIKLVGKENTQIVKGKIGNTTSTFYPDAHTETTSVDGGMSIADGTERTWATMRGLTDVGTLGLSDSGTNLTLEFTGGPTSGDNWIRLYRVFLLFDTSALGDTDTIDSSTLSVGANAGGKRDGTGSTPNSNIYASTPTSNTALDQYDFDNVGTTAFSTAIAYADYSATAYNDFALNASGLAAVSKTGISKFSWRLATHDVTGTTPTWVYDSSGFTARSADFAGTDWDPKLVVVHTSSVRRIIQTHE